VLELSAREARVAATMPLALTATDGMTIVLPAGLANGDQITIALAEGRAVLIVRVNAARKT
jgi:predicted FMN-binding regulatory protein PaiB